MSKASDPDKLIRRHSQLVHSDMMKVATHVQRAEGEWIVNTLTLEGHDIPFVYKRQKSYKDLTGQRVNLTYYPITQTIAGMDFEAMKVVRIKVS